jgi:hypothetical protein
VGPHVTLIAGRYGGAGAFPGTDDTTLFWIEPVFEPLLSVAWPVLLIGKTP